MNEDFGIKMSQKYNHSDMSYSKDIIAGPERHKITKDCFFFCFVLYFVLISLQSLLCKFKLYKSRLNHTDSLKIDKRDK